jgi:transposase
LKDGEERALYALINQLDLLVVGKKVKGELVVICSNVKNPNKILKTYRRRWQIERCFLQMKTQGFNLENTHMTFMDRLMKLMCIVTVALFLVSLEGLTQKCAYKKLLAHLSILPSQKDSEPSNSSSSTPRKLNH